MHALGQSLAADQGGPVNNGRPTVEPCGAAPGVAGNTGQTQFRRFGRKNTPKFVGVLSGNGDAKGCVGYLVARRILLITANQLNIDVVKLFPAAKVVEDCVEIELCFSFNVQAC